MRLPLVLALAGAVTLAGSSARAADAESPASELPRPTEQKRFYGWQNFVVGYGGAILAVRGVLATNMLMVGTGAVTWAFGGAVVHAAHHNVGAMIVSPFIMVGVPLLFYELGALTEGGSSYRSKENGLALAGLGALIAPIADGLLGWERVPKSFALAPEVGRERVALTVLGAF